MEIPTAVVAGLPDPLPSELSVLDVREPEEWQAGHIAGAVHIPLGQVAARMGEIPAGQVLVVCAVGGRSSRAAAYLQHQGHDVVNLDGGMHAWEDAGRAMVSETGAPPVVL